MATKTIDASTLEVLRGAKIDGLQLKLTCGQLDPKAYKAVNEVLARLGGKWKGGKVQAHVFDRDPAIALAEVLGSGEKPAKNPLAFFATPKPVAKLLIDFAAIPHSASRAIRILEPSAGEGAIVDALGDTCGTGHTVLAFEIDRARGEKFNERYHSCTIGDFLTYRPGDFDSPFDAVLMNPPFTSPDDKLAYIAHVLHAFEFLKPGGRLAAIVPSSINFSNTKRISAFREFVEGHGRWVDINPGSFKESGTGVHCSIVIVDKPGELRREKGGNP